MKNKQYARVGKISPSKSYKKNQDLKLNSKIDEDPNKPVSSPNRG